MTLKWSYKPLEQVLISKNLRELEILVKEIFENFPPNWELILSSRGINGKYTAGILKYFKDFFFQLRSRLKEDFSDDFADSIDILAGEILSLEKINTENWKCLVTDGKKRYHVVTNISTLNKGDIVPIAKLPPQIVHGVYSEGMFVGSSKGIRKLSSEDVGTRPDLTDKELGQSRGLMKKYFEKK
ncbi:MAG: hypothetical protein U9O98_05100 [Asgard group archaeon]|nr:hypothetical protein [Asgard group archaeon]